MKLVSSDGNECRRVAHPAVMAGEMESVIASSTSVLAPMVGKLEKWSPLADAEREALLALPHTVRTITAGGYVGRDGDRPSHCNLLLSGFAYRHKLTGDGGRQILAIHLRGDLMDLQNLFLEVSDHSVQTLTEAEVAMIPRDAMREVAFLHERIARALWVDTLVDASIFREWVVNVGRRDSRTRIAHILCEFSLRLEAAGLGAEHRYELPMTQEQLADAVGLTPVHVNRVLKSLGDDGLIRREKRSLVILNWERMREVGDFNDRYLHLEAAAA